MALCLALFLVAVAVAGSARQTTTVPAGEVAEVVLASDRQYENPFTDVKLDAVFSAQQGTPQRVPAFWDGQGKWCFRFSAHHPGRYGYTTECSDTSNTQLHHVRGEIDVVPYTGDNVLVKHGAIRVGPDRRHFVYEDGAPFFWLGDTWWKGLSKRITLSGFKQLAEDRNAKGFSVVQIVAGPYPDEAPFDPRWQNEAGFPYNKDYSHVNPAYFDEADKKIRELVSQGIVPVIVGGWGWHMPSVGVQNFERHWRYLIARYGAFPVVWIIGGEAGGPEWTQVARSVRDSDPFHRLITIHPYQSARRAVTDESVLDFDMLQTGHDEWGAAANTIASLDVSVSKTPPMPALVGEVTYEGHMMSNREDIQRFMFWTCMLNGAAGHTYGAGGIWQMNSDTVRGSEYEYTPWEQAMRLPGSTEIGIGKRLLEEYDWQHFEPHPEWAEAHGTTLLKPHAEWFDPMSAWRAAGGRYDYPYSAGIPGKVRVVYIPGGHPYSWNPPLLPNLDPGADYRAFYFDPVTGRRFDLGLLRHPQETDSRFQDDFDGTSSNWHDVGTKTTRQDGRLTAAKDMVSVVDAFSPGDALVTVQAKSDAEAGIVLRFHDANNYLVALYSPSLHAIYIHDRKNGEWGGRLGQVGVPQLGPDIRLTAAVIGNSAAFTVTDGKQSATIPTVRIDNLTPGPVGLWHYQIGDFQSFSGFRATGIKLDSVSVKPVGEKLVLNENPGLLPAFPMPDVSLLLGNEYQPPRLPVPQDWVIVLERI